jgi:hypothetical protein
MIAAAVGVLWLTVIVVGLVSIVFTIVDPTPNPLKKKL